MHLLAQFEEQVTQFESAERPSYEEWLRLELGPKFARIEELYQKTRERRLFALRISELTESMNIHPREALYLLQEGKIPLEDDEANEQEARRQAKRESKRSRRKEAKKEAKLQARQINPALPRAPGNALILLYRKLARKLHPDSPSFMSNLPKERARDLWMRVQEAYQNKNPEGLLAVAAWLEDDQTSEASSAEPLTLSERYARIKLLKRSLTQMEKKVTELTRHPAWGFKNLKAAGRKKLRATAARELELEAAAVQEALTALEHFIASIGPPRRVRW